MGKGGVRTGDLGAGRRQQPVVYLSSRGSEDLPAEGYRLSITPDSINLTGKGAGLFYGIQSLIQLFPNETGATATLPCLRIEDRPRFQYRGFMLDVSRHFFSIDQVKELLDWMAPVAPTLKKVFLVHGEPSAQQVLKAKIEERYKLEVICPKRGDRFEAAV